MLHNKSNLEIIILRNSIITLEDVIAAQYDELSKQLKIAADYVIANPFEVATRSMRTVARLSELTPPTFTRLAQALGFSSYETIKEHCREIVGQQQISISEKAKQLQLENDVDAMPLFYRQATASINNIENQLGSIDNQKIEQVVSTIQSARKVVLHSVLSSAGIAEYFGYMAQWIMNNWTVIGRDGNSINTTLTQMCEQDVFITITKQPFAKRSILAAKMAFKKDAHVVVITDSHTCPALKYAASSFILPTQSPQFFPSYVPTLVLIETIVGLLVTHSGPGVQNRIKQIEQTIHDLDDYWKPTDKY